jgi:hypothetical protein
MDCGEDRNDQEPKHQGERHIAPKPMDPAASDATNKSGSWDTPGDLINPNPNPKTRRS